MTDHEYAIAEREWRDPPAGGGSAGEEGGDIVDKLRWVRWLASHGDQGVYAAKVAQEAITVIGGLRAIVAEYRGCQDKVDCLSRARMMQA